ncbi:SinR family protein [Pseudomonas viridiflava]|uniref:SinR family protein n=1 Tax=Pseudomonas viridiflava TaxID=33069 RepID=UPI000F029FE3|nr:SinR family protein [Pseudomonas viridiflava]
MGVCLISYDLMTPGKDYSKIIPKIKAAYPDWWKCLDSTWMVKTDSTPQQVANYLLQFIDGNDLLIVVPIKVGGGGVWTTSFSKECQDWLKYAL